MDINETAELIMGSVLLHREGPLQGYVRALQSLDLTPEEVKSLTAYLVMNTVQSRLEADDQR